MMDLLIPAGYVISGHVLLSACLFSLNLKLKHKPVLYQALMLHVLDLQDLVGYSIQDPRSMSSWTMHPGSKIVYEYGSTSHIVRITKVGCTAGITHHSLKLLDITQVGLLFLYRLPNCNTPRLGSQSS